MAKNWSKFEVESAVEDYFNMLRIELSGRKYNKAAHRRALMERLYNRSEGSVELKHQNISAVLIEMGVPYIDGYKPRSNYQRSLLPAVVSKFLVNHPELQMLFQMDSKVVPLIPTVNDFLSAMEDPPKQKEKYTPAISESRALYNPAGVNYLEREAQNQTLGDAGEQFAINYEKARLIRAGKEQLSERIEQVSVTVGPSAGFDIRSFEENGTDRFIEAKTTKYGKHTPFFITSNELEFSKKNSNSYFLYRIFGFRAAPRVFALHGYLQDQCILKPFQYLARTA